MEIMDVLRGRYSERRFDQTRAVEESLVNQLLEAARLAPTAHNYQPFRLHLLRGETADARLREVTKCAFGAPLHVVLTAVDAESWVRPANGWKSVDLDIGIVGTQMALAAHGLGLETCMICAFDEADATRVFQLPEDERPLMILAVGYPSAESKPAPMHEQRRPLSELVREIR